MASHVHVLVELMDWFYGSIHLPATILILVWIYLYRNETFVFFRNVFLTMNLLAMTIFALLPVAPPRLVPTSGVVDTLYLYSTSNYRSGVLSFVTDQYAALPSLHIGYALFLSLAVFLLTTNRLARVLAAVYPVVVLAAILDHRQPLPARRGRRRGGAGRRLRRQLRHRAADRARSHHGVHARHRRMTGA